MCGRGNTPIIVIKCCARSGMLFGSDMEASWRNSPGMLIINIHSGSLSLSLCPSVFSLHPHLYPTREARETHIHAHTHSQFSRSHSDRQFVPFSVLVVLCSFPYPSSSITILCLSLYLTVYSAYTYINVCNFYRIHSALTVNVIKKSLVVRMYLVSVVD